VLYLDKATIKKAIREEVKIVANLKNLKRLAVAMCLDLDPKTLTRRRQTEEAIAEA
jgi:hypothetical protein